MELERKKELAFLYLQGELEPDEKQIVFDLILRDEVFRQCLKEEVQLRERMRQLQTALEPSAEQRLLAVIKSKAEAQCKPAPDAAHEPSWLPWSEWALRLTLPPLVYPLINTLQRRL